MTRTSPFAPTAGRRPAGWLMVLGLIVLPVVIAVVLGWSLAAPQQNLARVTAAVVNNDQPVTVNGQTVPLGRELAGQLIGGDAGVGAPDDPGPDPTATPAPGAGFTWVLTNEDDAAAGLADGTYSAVATIPESFSADVTSLSGPASDAVQATIEVTTTPTTAFLDPALTDVLVRTAVSTFNEAITQRYLAQVYDGFNQINSSIAEAASGADQLASGTASLSQGADQLAAGADQLASGLDQLDAGARALASGLDSLDASVQSLPSDTRQLAAGSAQVAAALDAGSAALAGATAEFSRIVDEICTTTGPLCTRAQSALARLESADSDVRALAGGADQVAAGNARLAAAMPPLVAGVDSADAGAADVAAGAGESAAGGASVAEGAGGVADGAAQAEDGASQLASGLSQAVDQIPTYSDDDIATLSAVAALPVDPSTNLPPAGTQSVPLFTMIALWVGAIITALAMPAVPRAGLLGASSTVRLTARALGPPLSVGAAQGATIALALAPYIDTEPWRLAGYILAAVGIGMAFTAINVGVAALLGGVGRAAAAVVTAIALVVGVSSTVPNPLVTVDGGLPTGTARDALLGTLGYGSLVGLLPLALWAVAGIIVTGVGIGRYRTGSRAAAAV